MLNSGFVRLGLFISLAPDDWNVAMDMDITVIQWGNYISVLYFLGTFILLMVLSTSTPLLSRSKYFIWYWP